jgi:hypothetical protein
MIVKLPVMMLLMVASLTSHSQTDNQMEKATKPLSCKLTTRELQERKVTVIANLKALVLERKESADGFSYKFDGKDEILDLINDFIKTERMCCDFFTFQLTVEDGSATLAISGPPGTKDFITHEIEL